MGNVKVLEEDEANLTIRDIFVPAREMICIK